MIIPTNPQNNQLKTPLGNTGVNATKKRTPKVAQPIEFKVDWLQGTFHTKYLQKIQQKLETLLKKGKFESRHTGIRYFESSAVHPSGAVTGTGLKKPQSLPDYKYSYLQLSGDTLLNCKQTKLRKFLLYLRRKTNFNCTRIDNTIDDYNRYINFKSLEKIVDKNDYVGFGDTTEIHYSGRKKLKGSTISFGSRGSAGGGKYLVIYDKFKESRGRMNCIRIELSCYDIYAKQNFEQLSTLPFCAWGDVIKGWISGSIDFVKRKHEKDKNPGRRKRYAFWNKIFKDTVKLKPSREYPQQTILKILGWFRRQVAPSLAVLINVFGKNDVQDFWDFFWEIVQDGENRFREKHKYLILTG